MEARSYGLGSRAQKKCQAWIDWMLAVTAEAQRVCRGPVLWVAANQTKGRSYQPGCEGLMYEWWKRGGSSQLLSPNFWHRVGIPGSGGDQWFRSDVEYIMCFKRPGKLPWTDNLACGQPPKHRGGGKCSHRRQDGTRLSYDQKLKMGGKVHTKRDSGNQPNGSPMRKQVYLPPSKSNPGNLIHTNAGGGHLGDALAHHNEAPFPEVLAERFILSLCPPGGTVLDPFVGSGTTLAVAKRHNRNGIGCDLRLSQVKLTLARLAKQTPFFPAFSEAEPEPVAPARAPFLQPELFPTLDADLVGSLT